MSQICQNLSQDQVNIANILFEVWSFARGWSIRMIICKRPPHPDNHLQEACPSGWSVARGLSIRMIICKRMVHPYDHLQEACPSGWSFARGRSIQMIICKWSVHPRVRWIIEVAVQCPSFHWNKNHPNICSFVLGTGNTAKTDDFFGQVLNIATRFFENEGEGQIHFGTFPKIHPFW